MVMAEASIAVFGAVAGVAIIFAIVCFVIRGRGHHSEIPDTARVQDLNPE
jgi:nitrate reductase gamma subunit